MTGKEKRLCDGCGEEIRFKHLARIRGKYYCKKGLACANIIRKQHRADTIKSAHLEEELEALDKKAKAEHAKERAIKARKKTYRKPIILEKDDKKKGNKTPLKYNPLVLSMDLTDKQFLYRRKIAEGFTPEEADHKVRELQEYLIDLGKTLRANKKLSDADKQKTFQEEFEKICYN